MKSHSQYLASPPLLFMTEVSPHAFKVLFVLRCHYYCLYVKVSKGKKVRKGEQKGENQTFANNNCKY